MRELLSSGAIHRHGLGAKYLFTPTSLKYNQEDHESERRFVASWDWLEIERAKSPQKVESGEARSFFCQFLYVKKVREMSKYIIEKNVSGIMGLCVIQPQMFTDNRGCLMEVYNEKEFEAEGLILNFVQDNMVHSRCGVLRGMHVNINHPQGKLIYVIEGKIFDVVVDLRKESETYKKWYGIELSAENRKQLYIPKGMGHGYLAMTDTHLIFKTTTHYIPGDEIGFSWKSKELGIEWPTLELEYIISKSDVNNKDINELEI